MHAYRIPEPELHLIRELYESTVAELIEQMREGRPWEQMAELRSSLLHLSAIMYDTVQSSEIPSYLPVRA